MRARLFDLWRLNRTAAKDLVISTNLTETENRADDEPTLSSIAPGDPDAPWPMSLRRTSLSNRR
jgi:hypothetical protein